MTTAVDVAALPLTPLGSIVGQERLARLEEVARRSREILAGRVVWNVNSTGVGGGVAEMLRVLVGYIRGVGIDCRWVVIEGDPDFFAITKRIHNRLHGLRGDQGPLGPAEAAHYMAASAVNASDLLGRIQPGDVVLLHDPQTVGMAAALQEGGAKVVWRSHVGCDTSNEWTEEAWEFLRPHLDACDAYVFSRTAYAPQWLPQDRVSVIPPSIDPFSPKNQMIADADLPYFLSQIGLTSGPSDRVPTFTRSDGSTGKVTHRAAIVSEGGPLPEAGRLVVQVSRWDRLKDMAGVLAGFASHVTSRVDAHLALVGPSVEGVADDPEGAEVLYECIGAWEALGSSVRRRVSLVSLPMIDVDENAAMVNAVQRSAEVIVQKSLREGFGLTVAEGMWKAKPVVASRVGGIADQVTPDTGILLDDPSDIDGFGKALTALLERPDEIARLGANAHRHVLDGFLGDRHLVQYGTLIERLLT